MIMNFIMSVVNWVLEYIAYPLFGFMGLDPEVLATVEHMANLVFSYIADGWKLLNIFIPYLDFCLAMAVFCLAVEAIYRGYLIVMWIVKKIPMLGVS